MKEYIKANWRRILAAGVLLIIFLYSAVRLGRYAVQSILTKRTNEELQELFDGAEGETGPEPEEAGAGQELLDCYQYIGDEILPETIKLVMENRDIVAWISIPGGVVDLPVVYRDNTYYLDHDFYGKRSGSGTLFLDKQHPLAEDTQYMVIHGHNMHDGSMFRTLSHYRQKAYMEEHPTVYLTTLYRKEEYEVVGVLYVPGDTQAEGYVPYVGLRKFQSADQFNAFAQIIQEGALHWKEGAQLQPGDAILALSTCYEKYRIVVMCRRISPQ